MSGAKVVICLLVLGLLVGTVSADNIIVHVKDAKNKPVSAASVNLTACGITKNSVTANDGTCTFDVSKTCNKITVYVNGALKWTGKFQSSINIKV